MPPRRQLFTYIPLAHIKPIVCARCGEKARAVWLPTMIFASAYPTEAKSISAVGRPQQGRARRLGHNASKGEIRDNVERMSAITGPILPIFSGALGHKQTFRAAIGMSAFGPKRTSLVAPHMSACRVKRT
jgi:hypothetical protein